MEKRLSTCMRASGPGRFAVAAARRLPVRLAGVVLVAGVLGTAGPALSVQGDKDPTPGPAKTPLIGLEQDGHTFRRPGTLLSQAERAPSAVDPEDLRRLQIERVTRRAHRDRAPAAADVPPAQADEEPESQAPAGTPTAVPSGPSTWRILVFLAVSAAAVLFVLRFTARRK